MRFLAECREMVFCSKNWNNSTAFCMVLSRNLNRKPLLEAIFELKWQLKKDSAQGIEYDPSYRLALARFSEKVERHYAIHEALPQSQLPDDLSAYAPQHRFRTGKNAWPLVQIGPGVVTLNDTNNYEWTDFYKRSCALMDNLFDAYPSKTNLRPPRTMPHLHIWHRLTLCC